ncbi:hypothetical protein GCM10010885_06060 [Alicyclobacillus cellulosilyticus]|uniref:Agmatinase n=1 Tax=Alicyclobacillus cellulosilyticus TaxID=1003997 RepID=A0A917K4C3_9BACL|nr:agmatinase family protein [Alicyclobacillus cellulosilyticus]GGI99570.1 hypothetical protein GCM10010885_06060 [Alicyclobacillus cellulosilyticus]
MSFYHSHGGRYREQEGMSFQKETLDGYFAALAEAKLPKTRGEEEIRRAIAMGLEAADSIEDRTISCFSRGELPHWAGINTFLKMPFLENVHEVDQFDIAILGVPFDIGTTYRPGTRFGPQAIRRISALYTTYNYELGVDLREQVKICDLGDVFTIANIEKSFDQITKAVSHVMSKGTMPIILGGDHAIGYPCLRGVAENIDGKVGIIHLDRHVDTQEKDMDERMHTTPWFHATNIPNAPPSNLVQIGIGGWQVPRAGVSVARERGTTILTMNDVERLGINAGGYNSGWRQKAWSRTRSSISSTAGTA